MSIRHRQSEFAATRYTTSDSGGRNELVVKVRTNEPMIQIIGTRMPNTGERPSVFDSPEIAGRTIAGRMVSPEEFVELFHEILPGLTVKYEPPKTINDPIVWAEPESDEVGLGNMISALRANGYEVTKRPDPGGDYVRSLKAFAEGCPNRVVVSDGEQAKLSQLVDALVAAGASPADSVEIYVEIDRALLISEFEKAIDSGEYGPSCGHDALWMHLWPVVIRVDEEGDIVLHATTAERAQFGTDG